MSRTLPLSPVHPDPLADGHAAAGPVGALEGTVAVFDPAMCCSTGLCGPGVDPALLAISRDLRWLEKQGVTITRAGLATDPQAFVDQPRIQGLLQAFGDGALPATLVNGTVLVYGRYATRDEIVHALQRAVPPAPTPIGSGSCEPGSGCC